MECSSPADTYAGRGSLGLGPALAAAGLTNHEIGQNLYIPPHRRAELGGDGSRGRDLRSFCVVARRLRGQPNSTRKRLEIVTNDGVSDRLLAVSSSLRERSV